MEIDRFETALARPHGERLRARLFTQTEIEYCERVVRSGERYAVRFAAKEAVRKAFGVIISNEQTYISWHDIEIISLNDGAPSLNFSGQLAKLTSQYRISKAFVSLSHSNNYAIAFVILETS